MKRIVAVLSLLACGGRPALLDAGLNSDAGGQLPDASVSDSGAPSPDAGDAGLAFGDGGRLVPSRPCAETAAQVYAAVPDGGRLGQRLACSTDQSLAGFDTLLVSYETRRGSGAPGASTARVWLPHASASRPTPSPSVVVAHPSEGIADSCAPSKQSDGAFKLAVPWVQRGYPVIAPDYAGLGNAGAQAYVDNHDTAYSVLDGQRALGELLEPGALDGRWVAVGYSQGGGGVLAAQALAKSYGPPGLAAVIGYAPQYFVRLDSFGYVTMLRNPDALTVAQGYTKPVVAALRQYGWYETYLGAGRGAEAFPSASAAGTVNAIESQCLIALGAFLPSQRGRVRDLIGDELRTTLLACVDAPTSAGCRDPGKRFVDGLNADLLRSDPLGAPVLFVQGALDTVMPIGEEAACVVPALLDAGVALTLCVDRGAAHNNVYDRNPVLAVRFGEEQLHGSDGGVQCEPYTLPACR